MLLSVVLRLFAASKEPPLIERCRQQWVFAILCGFGGIVTTYHYVIPARVKAVIEGRNGTTVRAGVFFYEPDKMGTVSRGTIAKLLKERGIDRTRAGQTPKNKLV